MKAIGIGEALNSAYLNLAIARNDFGVFLKELSNYLNRLDGEQDETYLKRQLTLFLDKTFYADKYEINPTHELDLAIHTENNSESPVGVLFELKRPSNTTEMVSKGDINRKSMQQVLFYYLRERLVKNNINLCNVVISNYYEWFIIDAQVFERCFMRDRDLVNQFKSFDKGLLAITSRERFYEEIAKPAIERHLSDIEFTYFDLRDYYIESTKDADDEGKYIELYKVFSPEHLLKKPFANDSNSLNEDFYRELLHIIGLEQVDDLIKRKKRRESGSIIENTIKRIKYFNLLGNIKDLDRYGATEEEKLFNVALELSITWINRILFIKLLEGQLLTFNENHDSYKFFNYSKITSFSELDTLFFQVLAIKEEDRNGGLKDSYDLIPYLNSSLFEPTELEKQTIFISSLRVDAKLSLYNKSVLKPTYSGNFKTLEYLFSFLDAFDFSSEGFGGVQEQSKSIINASVLGLIFEKINGYKDGSFYTPGSITSYMARETLRKAVVKKFNAVKNWDYSSFEDIKDSIERTDRGIREANEILNTIRICDPAVGSGHFLTSALNEMILIKYELGVLTDLNGRLLHTIQLEVVNDQLIVKDDYGKPYRYDFKSGISQNVQETLFYEKKTIIENCLFGVDINPNSVKICRLRLWIELLKNAFYRKEDGRLETLPNIDINIKTGNSLIRRFGLDADLAQALKHSKWGIESYLVTVQAYRDAKTAKQRKEYENIINEIKRSFTHEMFSTDPRKQKLSKLVGEEIKLTSNNHIFGLEEKEKKDIEKKLNRIREEAEKIRAEIEEEETGGKYLDAFEWRFEFPEVLDINGNFIGFDIVIGNPPYIKCDKLPTADKNFYRSFFHSFVGKADIYYLFFENSIGLIAENGYLSFITPNKYCVADSAKNLRNYMRDNSRKINILSLSNVDVFPKASNYPIITELGKGRRLLELKSYHISTLEELSNDKAHIGYNASKADWSFLPQSIIPININQKDFDFLIKSLAKCSKFSDYFTTSEGFRIKTDLEVEESYLHIVKQYQFGRYTPIAKGSCISEEDFNRIVGDRSRRKHSIKETKILIPEDALMVEATIDDSQSIPQGGVYFINSNDPQIDLFFALGVLNSKLFTYYYKTMYSAMHMGGGYLRFRSRFIENIPFVCPCSQKQSDISSLVNTILTIKKKNVQEKVKTYEDKIDLLVYKLYGLSYDEVLIVDQDFETFMSRNSYDEFLTKSEDL